MRRTLNGEGRVEIGGEDTNLLLHVGTKFAGAKAFNELHSRWKELCVPAGGSETDGSGFGNNGNRDWECTVEMVKTSERDLLGMCFGGKPHETKEQLEGDVETQKNSGFYALSGKPKCARRGVRCVCDYCLHRMKAESFDSRLLEIRQRLQLLDSNIESLTTVRKRARIFQKYKKSAETAGTCSDWDPVFSGVLDNQEEVAHVFGTESEVWNAGSDVRGQYLVEQEEALKSWNELGESLTKNDFPLRLVFLDKSGSTHPPSSPSSSSFPCSALL